MKKQLVLVTLALIGILGCSPEVPKLVPKPEIRNDKVDTDAGTEVFDPQLDILFVVDDSGSMSTHQSNVIANLDKFIQAFVRRASIDYHIGVLTTNMESFSGTADCCGELVGTPNFVEKTTPSLIPTLGRNIRVGTNGSGQEQSFSPVIRALSSPLVTGANKGFYRQNAHLAVIFVTDAEDQSRASARELLDFLVQLKGKPEKVLAYGVIIPSSAGNRCERDDPGKYPVKIEEFLSLVVNAGNNVFSLCDPKFGDSIATIADDLTRAVGNIIYLSRAPLLNTVMVSYGSQVIPPDRKKGWSFDPIRNALILGDEINWTQQPQGTKVRVFYEAADFGF